jgi:hypothetical protein
LADLTLPSLTKFDHKVTQPRLAKPTQATEIELTDFAASPHTTRSRTSIKSAPGTTLMATHVHWQRLYMRIQICTIGTSAFCNAYALCMSASGNAVGE